MSKSAVDPPLPTVHAIAGTASAIGIGLAGAWICAAFPAQALQGAATATLGGLGLAILSVLVSYFLARLPHQRPYSRKVRRSDHMLRHQALAFVGWFAGLSLALLALVCALLSGLLWVFPPGGWPLGAICVLLAVGGALLLGLIAYSGPHPYYALCWLYPRPLPAAGIASPPETSWGRRAADRLNRAWVALALSARLRSTRAADRAQAADHTHLSLVTTVFAILDLGRVGQSGPLLMVGPPDLGEHWRHELRVRPAALGTVAVAALPFALLLVALLALVDAVSPAGTPPASAQPPRPTQPPVSKDPPHPPKDTAPAGAPGQTADPDRSDDSPRGPTDQQGSGPGAPPPEGGGAGSGDLEEAGGVQSRPGSGNGAGRAAAPSSDGNPRTGDAGTGAAQAQGGNYANRAGDSGASAPGVAGTSPPATAVPAKGPGGDGGAQAAAHSPEAANQSVNSSRASGTTGKSAVESGAAAGSSSAAAGGRPGATNGQPPGRAGNALPKPGGGHQAGERRDPGVSGSKHEGDTASGDRATGVVGSNQPAAIRSEKGTPGQDRGPDDDTSHSPGNGIGTQRGNPLGPNPGQTLPTRPTPPIRANAGADRPGDAPGTAPGQVGEGQATSICPGGCAIVQATKAAEAPAPMDRDEPGTAPSPRGWRIITPTSLAQVTDEKKLPVTDAGPSEPTPAGPPKDNALQPLPAWIARLQRASGAP